MTTLMILCWFKQYLRKPTTVGLDKQLAINEEHG
jgi:hypothetical protein